MTLAFRPFRPGGGGLTANSWAPGIGGGRKDEDGDGNGEHEGGASTQRDNGRRSLLCTIKAEVSERALVVIRQRMKGNCMPL
jgi:hypothetical protein